MLINFMRSMILNVAGDSQWVNSGFILPGISVGITDTTFYQISDMG
ncbi:hypothetical protein A464_2149 [Salmonella bongori N268-08]|uniref:Uncharacterized protein n=1 Tax=Salmonella bongori N268-08 TaxID=1197719 RepID=S5MXL5_SALBN|nr:hypothetical protein A464_2149 [Salmonella bongori N268-08]